MDELKKLALGFYNENSQLILAKLELNNER